MRAAHLASLSIGGAPSADGADGGNPRTFDFYGMTPGSAGRKLERIHAGNALMAAASPIVESQSSPAPFVMPNGPTTNVAPPPSANTVVKPIGWDKGLGSPGPTTLEESERLQAEVDAHDQRVRENNKQPPPPVITTPAVPPAKQPPTTFEQLYPVPDTSSPAASPAPSLAELAVPGSGAGPTPDRQPERKAPSAFEQIYLGPAETSPAATTSVPSNLAELAVPGYKTPSTPPPAGPQQLTVTAGCTTAAPPTPGVVPTSITNPVTTFRTGTGYANGFSYTPEQLAADMATVGRGPVAWVGPGNPYDAAYARLSAAQYTVEEQRIDLLWAQYDARTDEARAQQLEAMVRLRQAGIPWRDLAIESFVRDRENTPISTDPYAPPRWTAPPKYTPAQLRQQIIEANRTDTTLRELVNNSIDDMFVDPATVLWESAHGKGDHSGWDITWAAAKLGVNVMLVVPGPGAAAAAGVKAGLRRFAPELWEAFTGAETAAQAARVGNEFRTKQLLDDLAAYGERTRLPAPHAGGPNPPRLELPAVHPDAAPLSRELVDAGVGPVPARVTTPVSRIEAAGPRTEVPSASTGAPLAQSPGVPVRGVVGSGIPGYQLPHVVGGPLRTNAFVESEAAFAAEFNILRSDRAFTNSYTGLVEQSRVLAGGRYEIPELGGAGSTVSPAGVRSPFARLESSTGAESAGKNRPFSGWLSSRFGPVRSAGRSSETFTVYHGTSLTDVPSLRAGINPTAPTRYNKDFGPGFYTTKVEEEAWQWAQFAANRSNSLPAVLEFQVSKRDLENLTRMIFRDDSADWATFVTQNRRADPLPHGFDTVEGPYIGNLPAFRKGAPPVGVGHQLSWHTADAVQVLRLIKVLGL